MDDERSVQLIDFGLARVLNASMSRQKSVGTYSFMAPELHCWQTKKVEGKDVVFQDMWSFGATLLDCIIGCHIIDEEDDDPNEIIWLETGVHPLTNIQWSLDEVLKKNFVLFPETEALWMSVDPAIRTAIKDCLSHDYRDRPTASKLISNAAVQQLRINHSLQSISTKIKTKASLSASVNVKEPLNFALSLADDSNINSTDVLQNTQSNIKLNNYQNLDLNNNNNNINNNNSNSKPNTDDLASIPFRLKLLSVQDVSFWLEKIGLKPLVSLFQKQEITGFSLALIRNKSDLNRYGLDVTAVGLSQGKIDELLELIDDLRNNDVSDDHINPVSNVSDGMIVRIYVFMLFRML